MDQVPIGKKRQIIATLAVLIVVVVIVGAVASTNKKKVVNVSETASVTSAKSTTNTSPASSTATTTTSGYKDGEYSATGSYESPGGQESITVDVTLHGGVVTATSAKSGAGDPEAMEYQSDFISGYKSHVVGKSIASLSLSRVSGSSLTSQGFNSAIQKIKSEAQA